MATREIKTGPLEAPPRSSTSVTGPETIRLPRNGEQDPHFGMTRSALNALILPTKENEFKPPVRSFVLRRKGARTGIRLIDFQSLREFIFAHEEANTVSNE